jgi:phage shock protein PspC (stress-responsive transcriptional regulator)
MHDPGGNAYWPRPRRLQGDRVIGGVAAGLSAWLGVPVVAMRLLFVIAALLNGIGVLAYAALWLALPVDGDDTSQPSHLRVIIAAMLGATAALLLLDRFDLPRSGVLLPVLLVGTGVALWRQNPVRRPRSLAHRDDSSHRTSSPTTVAGDNPTTPVRRVRLPNADAREPQSPLARIAFAIAFAALAVALLADRGDAFDLTPSRGASLLLVVLGAALIVGARYGRARWLVIVAVPLAISLPVTSTFDDLDVDPFEHVGERTYFVDEIASTLAPSYSNGVGPLTVNLAGIEADGKTRRTEVRSAIGPIDVFVPRDVQVVVHARVGWGKITVVDYDHDPSNRSSMRSIRLAEENGRDIENTTIMAGEPGGGSLDIEVASGLGPVRVVRAPWPANTVVRPPITTTTTPTTTSLANTTIETR